MFSILKNYVNMDFGLRMSEALYSYSYTVYIKTKCFVLFKQSCAINKNIKDIIHQIYINVEQNTKVVRDITRQGLLGNLQP
jgi:hypothetical protein